jgi:hypothetical protein
MPSVFVSYRRTDEPGHAGRLYDRLVEQFGTDNVFRDVDAVEPGADFVEVIEAMIAQADVLVAVIGRGWLGRKRGGVHRLDDPHDWVRTEISLALERGIRVVPVLVGGASMPSLDDLPDELKPFARRNAVELTETAWRGQVDALIESLQRGLRQARAPELPPGTEVLSIDHDRAVNAVTFSPDGNRIATACGDAAARVWSLPDGQELLRVIHGAVVSGVDFAPDGRQLATSAADLTARVWSLADGRETLRVAHDEFAQTGPLAELMRDSVNTVAFSPDGARIATAATDRTARVWSVPEGRELARLSHEAQVLAAVFSPRGDHLATACADGTARVWALADGRELLRLDHESAVNDVAYTSDGDRLGTVDDAGARVWSVSGGRQLVRIEHPTDTVWALAFPPDGTSVATVDDEGSVRVWSLPDGRELLRVQHEDAGSVAFSPDGRRLATGSGGRAALRVWAV